MSEQRIKEPAGPSGTAQQDGPAVTAAAAPRPAAPPTIKARRGKPKWLLPVALLVLGGLGFAVWKYLQPAKLPEGFVSSNGRIEATEVDIATKNGERLVELRVDEGDFVHRDQVLAKMNTEVLTAQLREAQANHYAAETSVETARYTLAQRASQKEAARAVVLQRQADFDVAEKNFARAQRMIQTRSISQEEYDAKQSAFYATKAAVATSRADLAAAGAAVSTAKTAIILAEAAVKSSQAKVERIQADIKDSTLLSPREGRVQYRIAQVGEVLPGGGKVLNMIDLNDVYMTFFLPTDWAGRVKLGTDVRIVLDAAPQFVIPAKVTFVADVAQFTPKTVETAVERQKLTFRIKAHIPPKLLKKYVRDVKTGLPGVAYVQLDPKAEWPANLQVRLPE
jgi:HlyD family secretion protein